MTEDTVLAKVKRLPIVHALALIANGNTKLRACEIAGVSVSTFQRVIDEHPEVALDFIQTERAKIVDLYSDILEARAKLVKALIADADVEDLAIKDELAIESRLRELQKSIEEELSLIPEEQAPKRSEATINAENFLAQLTGPQLKQGVGVTLRKTTEVVELSLSQELENVIDGQTLDTDTPLK